MTQEYCSASLVIASDSLDSGFVGAATGVQPTKVTVDIWERTVVGPTPIDAPFAASECAAALLASLRLTDAWRDVVDEYEPFVEVSFIIDPLLTFSFELTSEVVAQIATLGVPLELDVYDGRRDRSKRDKLEAVIEVWSDDRDPQDITRRLGVEPTEVLRAGEQSKPHTKRMQSGVWRVEAPADDFEGLGALIGTLADRVSTTAWPDVRRDYKVRAVFNCVVSTVTTRIVLDAEVVAKLAALGVPLAVFFYNFG